MSNVESPNRSGIDGGQGLGTVRQHEDIDRVLLSLVRQSRDRPSAEVIETAADQRKAGRREIDDWWREIKLAQEPRFHRVLIAGADVEQVIGHERSHVTVDRFFDDRLASRGRRPDGHDPADDCHDQRGRSGPRERR